MSYRAILAVVPFLCVAAHANLTTQPAITETVTRKVVGVATAQAPQAAPVNVMVPAVNAQPTVNLVLAMTEVVNGMYRSADTNVLSRSNPNQRICWQATGVANGVNGWLLEEIISSPAAMQFADPNAEIYSSNGGTTHAIYSRVSGQGDTVTKCWRFDNTDPVGNYGIAIKINGTSLPPARFVITP